MSDAQKSEISYGQYRVMERLEAAIRMAIQAAVADQIEDRPGSRDGRTQLVWVYDEAPLIARYVTTSKSWLELAELVAELERLRDGLRQIENMARLQALSDRVRANNEERHWLDLLAIIERVEQP